MTRDYLIVLFIVLLGASAYLFTLRGQMGNPRPQDFKDNLDTPPKAFELSPERGRYVHVVNMAERGTYDLSPQWAAIAYPDVGIAPDGKISSYFAPGVAYMTLPLYRWGSQYNLGQVATFAGASLVTIVTLVFIYLIGRRIFTLSRAASFFAVLVYAFASTSWSYATTLYQNPFTTCFMVTAFYAAWRFAEGDRRFGFFYAAYIWLAYALAISVDYPNVLLMLPVMVYFAYTTIRPAFEEGRFHFSMRWSALVASLVFVVVLGLQLVHNTRYYGSWHMSAGGLIQYVPTEQHLISESVANTTAQKLATAEKHEREEEEKDKNVAHFFRQKNIPHGIYILFVSRERGLFYYTPLFLLSLIGVGYMIRARKVRPEVYGVPLALIALNLFLYSSWGDPWGGWAYGPRYLIPIMPWLSLLVALFLYSRQALLSRILWRMLAYGFFLFSSAVALLGALTTNAIPPKGEALLLPIKTFDFWHNVPYLLDNQSGSFFYNTYLIESISLVGYYVLIYCAVALIAGVTLLFLGKEKNEQ